jgi:hypothetical protein
MIEELKVPVWTEHDYRDALQAYNFNPPDQIEETEEEIEAEAVKLREGLEKLGLSEDIQKLWDHGVRSRHKLATLTPMDIESLELKGTQEEYESLYGPALESGCASKEFEEFRTFTHEYLVRCLERAKKWRDKQDAKEMKDEIQQTIQKKQKLPVHEEGAAL